jgi:importin-7
MELPSSLAPYQQPLKVCRSFPKAKRRRRLTIEDREEALKDDFHLEGGTYGYDDEDEEWNEEEASWDATEGDREEEVADVKDEGTAYLEFLQEEVRALHKVLHVTEITDSRSPAKSAKYGNAAEGEYSEEELGEDSVLLESPLDQIDPYTTFRTTLMSKSQRQPPIT